MGRRFSPTETTRETTMKNRNYPSSDEMIIIVATARRNRARMMKVLFRKGLRALKSRLAHGIALPTGQRVSHA
jgi:hypothetical protein